jgi:hypothetical protein
MDWEIWITLKTGLDVYESESPVAMGSAPDINKARQWLEDNEPDRD